MFIIQPYEDILEEAINTLNSLRIKSSMPETDCTELLKSYREVLKKIESKRENNKNSMFDEMTAQDLYEDALDSIRDEQEKLRKNLDLPSERLF